MADRPRIDPGSQQRSRATFERIVVTAQEMMDGRDWATVTVEDLCLAADVSPSSFYRRFRSKDALLDVVHQRWLDQRSAVVEEFVDTFPWEDLSPRAVCELIAYGYIEDRLAVSERAFSIMRMQASHPRLADRAIAQDKVDLARFATPLADATGCDYQDACFGLVAISHTIIAAVQSPRPWLEILEWSKEDLVARCVAAFAAITGGDLDGARADAVAD